jgi:hypothetical protein
MEEGCCLELGVAVVGVGCRERIGWVALAVVGVAWAVGLVEPVVEGVAVVVDCRAWLQPGLVAVVEVAGVVVEAGSRIQFGLVVVELVGLAFLHKQRQHP